MEELLYGLMMRSGNDCAIAIAEHIGGSVEGFASLMNSKAFDIGAFNTHFATPHGLDTDGHFTTALDLALITRYALKNDTFSKIVSAKEAVINGANGPVKFQNINKMLWSFEGADGVKTGYTGKAGRCLVASASRNGRKVISIVINSSRRWEDSKKLLDYGLDSFTIKTVVNSGYYQKINISGGDKASVKAGIDSDINIPLSDNEGDMLSTRTVVYDDIKAPVFKGQVVGRLVVYSNSREIYSVPLRCSENVRKLKIKNFFQNIIGSSKEQ
jgi:D-alanyl-D-alanine carboxypeptidase